MKLSSYTLQNATHVLAELCDIRYLRAAQDFALPLRTEHGVEAVADWAEGA